MNSGVRDFYLIAGTLDLASYELEVIDNFTQSGGTFTGNTGDLDVLDFYLTGGTFTAPSGTSSVAAIFDIADGGTFNHNNAWWVFDGSTDATADVDGTGTFWDLQINRTSTRDVNMADAADVFFVLNDLVLTDGQVDVGTISASGNVTVTSGYDSGTALLEFVSDGNQTFDLTGATNTLNTNVTVNKTGGTVTLASDFDLDAVSKTFTLTAGALDLDGNAFSVDGSSCAFTQTGGTMTGLTGALSFMNFTWATGTFDASSASSINVDGPFVLSGGTFNATSNSTNFGDAFTDTAGGTFNHSNGTVVFDGPNDRTTDVNGTGTF